jgi:KDO2-lipid IV(A) lauroyltransferase
MTVRPSNLPQNSRRRSQSRERQSPDWRGGPAASGSQMALPVEPANQARSSKWRARRERMHTVARRLFATGLPSATVVKETMKDWLEYAAVAMILKALGALPRSASRGVAASVARAMFALLPKLQRTAEFNLRLAFPEWDDARRKTVIRAMVRNLGWMAAEFARLPRYSKKNIEDLVILDSHENFLEGQRRGKGVLYLTGHIGAWELSSFAHALYGFPLHYMARPLDNARVDALVNRYRCLSGNQPIFKNESARAVLKILREAGTVGILADQNTMPEEGVFVDFFGKTACTTTGIARVALHTNAAVVPGYAFWDAAIGRYRLRFEPPVELVRTGDNEQDIFVNTQKFAKVIEGIIRKHPDQWVWVHARWKTRPKGEPPLYDFL